jgi:hypothetical protein
MNGDFFMQNKHEPNAQDVEDEKTEDIEWKSNVGPQAGEIEPWLIRA